MISIVTVTYNNLAGLIETARSIESQEYPEFRWIVVDGASTDGSQQFVSGCSRLTRLVSEPDEGIYDAMRKGLTEVDTEYVLFLNAGDVLHGPRALAAASRIVSAHDVYFFDTAVESNGMSWRRVARPLGAARYSVPSIQQSTIYRVAVLRRLAWPSDYRICGDYFLAAQLLVVRATSCISHECLSRFRLGGISTQSVFRLCIEASRVQRECLSLSLPLRMGGFLRRMVTGYGVAAMHYMAQRVNRKSP